MSTNPAVIVLLLIIILVLLSNNLLLRLRSPTMMVMLPEYDRQPRRNGCAPLLLLGLLGLLGLGLLSLLAN